jgi:hypothetical protein
MICMRGGMLTSNTVAEIVRSQFPAGPLLSSRDEITRVREHFLGAILAVGRAPTAGLSREQRRRRRRLLGRLIRYAVAGRFPKNVSRPGRLAPTFVDHEGTRCAVAYLMESEGAGVLVDRIVGAANHAFVPELALDAVVRDWLLAQGVSVEEAARIQPSYCYSAAEACVCGGDLANARDLVAGGMTAERRFLVDEVFRSEAGIAEGDELDVVVDMAFEEGVRVLAKGDDGAALLLHAFVDEDTLSVAACRSGASDPPQTVELGVVLDIANGSECVDTLEEVDSRWTEVGSCDDCSFSAVPAQDTALLYALMAGLALARRLPAARR